MSTTGKYVITTKSESGEEEIQLTEEAYIGHSNINSMKFSFSPGQDITENLNKRESRDRTEVTATKKGRVAYSSLICTYPNGETSSKIILQGCILQYRKGIKSAKSDYGRGFVCIGIPETYVSKIMGDAKTRSTLTVKPKPKVKRQEGYYWFDCTLEKLLPDKCFLAYDAEGEFSGIPMPINDMFEDTEKSILADIAFTCSGSQTTESMAEKIDLNKGVYYLTLKPTSIQMTTETDIVGPTLDDTNRRFAETITPSSKSMASERLLAIAMKRMNMQ